MIVARNFLWTWIVGIVGLHASASAQTVHLLSGGAPQPFPDIQPAVDAANDGDVLLLAAGSYSPFEIQGKALTLFAMEGSTVEVTQGSSISAMAIRQVAPGKRVIVSGLQTLPGTGVGASFRCLLLEANPGWVSLQDCAFQYSGQNWFDPGCGEFDGATGGWVTNSARVSFSGCEFRGAGGSYSDEFCVFHHGTVSGDGGVGLHCLNSRVALQDCQIEGARGASGTRDSDREDRDCSSKGPRCSVLEAR